MRKTALLTGAAGLFLMTAPAFAQDSTAPQTPPAAAPAAAPAATEQPQSLTLEPGSDVMGSDGSTLGKLEGARNTAAGQELTVRGADGVLRGVPVSGGVRQEGEGVAVGWTSAQFNAAAAISDDGASAEVAGEADANAEAETETEEPTESAQPGATPATPATPAEPGVTPTTPASPATPATPAAGSNAAPPAGEAADKPGA